MFKVSKFDLKMPSYSEDVINVQIEFSRSRATRVFLGERRSHGIRALL